MTTITTTLRRAKFGIDSSRIVRNLFIISLISSLFILSCLFITNPVIFWLVLIEGILASATFALTGIWMLCTSLIFKPRHLSNLAKNLDLKGDETILDMGCGKGTFLCSIAKHITSGHIFGIDLWSNFGQKNNTIEKAWANAQTLGLLEKVDLQTADMCNIPYPDEKFDVIVTNIAINKIPTVEARQMALKEMLRTLKPGGRFVISDYFHIQEYTNFLALQRNIEFEVSAPYYLSCPTISVIYGTKSK